MGTEKEPPHPRFHILTSSATHPSLKTNNVYFPILSSRHSNSLETHFRQTLFILFFYFISLFYFISFRIPTINEITLRRAFCTP